MQEGGKYVILQTCGTGELLEELQPITKDYQVTPQSHEKEDRLAVKTAACPP